MTMTATSSPAPRRLSAASETLARRAGFRHNPYAFELLNAKDRNTAVVSFVELYNGLLGDGERKVQAMRAASKGSSLCPSPVPQCLEAEELDAAKSATTAEICTEDGVSETSSDVGSGERSHPVRDEAAAGFSVTGSHHNAAAPAATPAVIRYASVNFRFGSAWFVAPFRTFTGDMVVVQYPGNNNSLHMGLVSNITTAKPITFYTESNMDSNYLSPEELLTAPRLLRHARDFDKETKLDLRSHDLRSLTNARKLAEELGAAVQFLDAEWLLDLSAVTFLVKVYGSSEMADQLVDELALQEGAEVVFTYPVSSSMY